MDQVPFYISFSFIALVVYTLVMFFKASGKNKGLLLIVLVLALVQAMLSQRGFFLITDTMPPRLLLLLIPSVVLIVLLFITKSGKRVVASFNLETLTYLHAVRIGVEIILFYLFIYRLIPESMTFAGRNFDVIAGLTAPIIAYFGFNQSKISKKWLIVWNVVCLLLVLQVMITGIFSIPTSFQVFTDGLPNMGVLYFPFVWLPGLIVPIAVLGHLVAIKRLTAK
jgi:hypothetical protein